MILTLLWFSIFKTSSFVSTVYACIRHLCDRILKMYFSSRRCGLIEKKEKKKKEKENEMDTRENFSTCFSLLEFYDILRKTVRLSQ